jgi:hypothetical protein
MSLLIWRDFRMERERELRKVFADTMIPSGDAALGLGTTTAELDKFRRIGGGEAMKKFKPTVAEGTHGHFYSLEDLVRVGVIWAFRHNVKPRHRDSLWGGITRERIIEAFERLPERPLFMLVTLTSDEKQPVRVRFADVPVDMTAPGEEPEIHFNLSAIVRGMWAWVEKLSAARRVKFDPSKVVQVVKK